MSGEGEYCCYIGGLAFSTSERGLKEAFEKFGRLVDAKVVIDKFNGRSRGFGFVTFDEKKAMEEAIEAMNGMDLDGRNIIVEKAQTPGSGRDQDGDRSRDRGRDRDRGSYRDYGGGRGSNGGECFKCGKPGHFARECPSEGGGGSRYGGRDDRYGGRDDRNGGRDDRYGGRDDRNGGRDDRYGGRDDRYGGGEGGGRFGPDRNGDRSGGRSRDSGNRGGPGNDRYNRDRSGPYERRGSGSGNYR